MVHTQQIGSLSIVPCVAVLMAGVLFPVWTGHMLIDAALAALVAVHVLWSGPRPVSELIGGLMDAAPPNEITERIRHSAGEYAYSAREAHDLRTRHAGRLAYLSSPLVVPGELTVSGAHDSCDRIEAALREDMRHLVITSHVEREAKAKHQVVLVL